MSEIVGCGPGVRMGRLTIWICWYCSLCAVTLPADAVEPAGQVQPPGNWSQDVLDAFFEDARGQLAGTRPTSSSIPLKQLAAEPKRAVAADGQFKWSLLIDADTLTAEIRRLSNQLALSLKRSATFQSGGNLACRRDFGLLAVLFGVVADFDGDMRWQRSAAALRQRCLVASRNCKVATAQTYADAKDTHAQLQSLLRGQAPASDNATGGEAELVDRTLLMQAMELTFQEKLAPAMASMREFRKRAQAAAEQAQVLAVLATVIREEGYEYYDDEDFLLEAKTLKSAASELSQAASDKDYEAARAAAGRVGQSCSRCHEGYRG
ncbi:MAG: cytochrome c [Planctomycetota bacterium]